MSDVDENEIVQKSVTLLPFRVRSSMLSDELTQLVMAVVTEAVNKHSLQKDLAEFIKKEIDLKPELNTVPGKGPWQCILGKSFATAITHEPNFAIFVDLIEQRQTLLLFKSIGVQSS